MKSFASISIIVFWIFALFLNCLSPKVEAQTCSIQILHVNGIVPPGNVNPTQLRIIGKASNCPGNTVTVETDITGQSAPTAVDPSTGDFAVTFQQLNRQVSCNINFITIKAWCTADSSNCNIRERYQLKCCEVPTLFFQAFVPAGSLTPTEIRVYGTLLGCYNDQVVVSARMLATNTLIGQSLPTSVYDRRGSFFVSLPGVTVNCDDRIKVKAWCAVDSTCYAETDGLVDCGECPRAKVRPITAPCIGAPSKQPIQLEAIISIPAGNIMYFLWDYGDGIAGAPHWASLPPFKADNSSGTANTTFLYTTPSNNYAPGSYTARLVNVDSTGVQIGECADILLPLTVQCPSACPTATVKKTGESATCVNGKRTVTIEATITSPTPTSSAKWRWNFGYPLVNPQFSSWTSFTGQMQTSTTFDYPGGSYTACIEWDRLIHPDPACKDECVTFAVDSCPPPICDVKLTYSPDPVPCISAGGSQKVDFVATFDPAYTGPLTWEVSKGGSSLQKVTQYKSATLPNPEKFSYSFTSPGAYIVTVTVSTPSPPCDDPFDSDAVNIQIDDCCPKFSSHLSALQGATPCDWFFSTQVKNPNSAPLSFEWDFGDGNVQTTKTAGISHTYTTGGRMHVIVTVKSPGCTDTQATDIDVCKDITPPTVTQVCGVSAGTPGTITVTFSEDVDQTAAQDRANYAITVNGQTVPPTSITSISYDPASSTATINGVTISPGETVIVTVTGVPDKAGNVIVGNNQTNVANCKAPSNGKSPTGRPQWPDWLCGILLALALLALAVALIVAFIWGCTLASGNPVSLGTMLVTGGALLIFLICIVLWGFFCASAHCGILCALITTVMWLIGITFIALIILVILLNPCFLGTIFDGALLGLALAILIRIAQAVGCAIPVWPSFLCP